MGSQTTVNNCGFIIYDNGGQSGDYAANVDQTLTIHSNDPGNGCVMVEIQNLDIDPSDTLIFYDGVGTGGTELHRINNSNYDPTGTFRYAATIQNSTGALTIRFVSDSAGGGAGFTIFASCMAPCQRVEIHLDTIHSSHKPHIDPDDGYYYVDVCPYDTVHFVAYCDYPDNNFSYPQSHALTTFMWDFDLSEVDSLGLTTVDHYFTPGRGYDVAISAVDSAHCPSLIPVTFRVRTSKNPIRDVAQLPPICAGQQLDLSVGYDHLSSGPTATTTAHTSTSPLSRPTPPSPPPTTSSMCASKSSTLPLRTSASNSIVLTAVPCALCPTTKTTAGAA